MNDESTPESPEQVPLGVIARSILVERPIPPLQRATIRRIGQQAKIGVRDRRPLLDIIDPMGRSVLKIGRH